MSPFQGLGIFGIKPGASLADSLYPGLSYSWLSARRGGMAKKGNVRERAAVNSLRVEGDVG